MTGSRQTPNPTSTNLYAEAQELVRKTYVDLTHPSKVQFLRLLRAAGARLEVIAGVSDHRVTEYLSRGSSTTLWRLIFLPGLQGT